MPAKVADAEEQQCSTQASLAVSRHDPQTIYPADVEALALIFLKGL